MEILTIVPATALGYLTFRIVAHPSSRIRKKLPNIKTKRVQIFPVIRFFIFGRVFHLHHWFNFSILLILSFFINNGFLDNNFTTGILMGGVLHGLSLPSDKRRLIYKDFSLERLVTTSKKR